MKQRVILSILALLMDWNGAMAVTEIGRIYYQIAGTASAVVAPKPNNSGAADLYYGDIVIPPSFSYRSRTYIVTGIGDKAFSGCKMLTSVTIPNTVSWIGEDAFYGSYIESVTIGNGVSSIGEAAFCYCNRLTDITIPDNVTSIGQHAFAYCHSLISITIPDKVTSIEDYTFAEDTVLVSVTLPKGVTSIGKSAFSWCWRLSSITIPENVTSIGDYAFSLCGLTSVTIPDNVTSIGNYAFSGPFTSLTIGEKVKSIGRKAFSSSNLTSVTIRAKTPPELSDPTPLGSVPNNIPIYIPCGTKEAYSSAWGWNLFTNFIEQSDVTITVTSEDENMGSTRITKQHSCEDSECTFEAIANEHYHFVGWDDGNTDNPRTVRASGDKVFTAKFAINQYTITTYASNGNVSGGGSFDYGTTITLTATADEHYNFTRWSDGNTDNPRTVVVEGDMSYTAEYQPNQYTITIVAGDYGNVDGEGSYDYGTAVTLTATANEHYHFVQWNDGNRDNPRSVVVEGDATYSAVFAIDQCLIRVSDNAYGSIDGGGWYDYGSRVVLTVFDSEHYHFVQWSDGNTDNPRYVTAEGDATYTAEFAPNQCSITTDAEYGSVEGAGVFDYGTTAVLTAVADEHYHFVQWNDGNTDNPRTITIEGDAMYVAEFAADPQYTIETYAENGSVVGGGVFYQGEMVTLRATANEHYHFVQWSDGDIYNPRLVIVKGDATYTAEFAIDTYAIMAICDEKMGVILGNGTYPHGVQVRLEACANSGYEFVQWSNGMTYNPYLFTATEDLTLEAQFVPTTAVENVSADGTTPQKVFRDGQVYILRDGKTYTLTGEEVK